MAISTSPGAELQRPLATVEAAVADPQIKYALGSVLNHVLLYQTVIGEEALLQFAKIGE